MKVTLLRVPNPGLFTGEGTNTWIIEAGGAAAVVDPGPVIPDHLTAIRLALEGLEPVAVLVTHTHPDHAPAANPLGAGLGVPTYGCGPGPGFLPDVEVGDGQPILLGDAEVTALHTPGHTADHVCYLVEGALFTGDHVIGGSTVVVEHMPEYLDSLQRLRGLDLKVMYPGHGSVIRDPGGVLDYYLEHRMQRERQILAAVRNGATTLGAVVAAVYAEVDRSLHFAAAQSVGAHLRKLADEGLVEIPMGADDWGAPVQAGSEL
jgi:glyoxylase-like metal-dependent hydrolase (beta-lactamase superfamily II)